ncbi:MAG TPA: DNA methyltransferase [Gemmata sp.]
MRCPKHQPTTSTIVWLPGDFRTHSPPANTFRAIVTDPPYGKNYLAVSGDHEPIANDGSVEVAATELTAALAWAAPALLPEAHYLGFCDWASVEPFAAALTTAGFTVRRRLVWDKCVHTNGYLGTFGSQCELLLHATRGAPALRPRLGNVLRCPRVRADRHPTEKPVPLLRKLIECTTRPGEWVLDMFGGVASTAAAAQGTGRRCWSCEVDEKYFAAGQKRLTEE